MSGRVRFVLAVLLTAAGVVTTGCGKNDTPAWIGAQAAVVRCTQAGRERMPPVLLHAPVPEPPTGLYARALDPISLDALGYERDQVACAMLEAPDPELASSISETLDELVAMYEQTSVLAVREGGRCTCDIAHAMGVRDLIEVCRRTPTQKRCSEAGPSEAMARILEPLHAAIRGTELPLVHWRLVGRTDRPGWFADNIEAFAANHSGGSTAYRRGQAVPMRGNGELVRTLLAHDDVVAVVRQDAGRALLVAREVGNLLVLDHFAHVEVSSAYEPLLSYLDNALVEHYLRRLERPRKQRKPGLDPKKGYLAQIDRPGLEAVDAMLVAASRLSGRRYEEASERRVEPEVLVDRVTLQAPFGQDGAALLVRFELGAGGRLWAQTLGKQLLSATLDELGLAGHGPEFEPARASELAFFLRGTAVNEVLVHGLHRVPEVMKAIEMAHPSSIGGRANAWRFELPAKDPVPEAGASVARSLRDEIAATPYVVTAELDGKRDALQLELRPRSR